MDCTQVPGFVSMNPPTCPSGTTSYVKSMTNGCPVFECLDNAYSYGPVGNIFNPSSTFATVGDAQDVLNTLISNPSIWGNGITVAGASTADTAIALLQNMIANAPYGSSSTLPLNPIETTVTTTPQTSSTGVENNGPITTPVAALVNGSTNVSSASTNSTQLVNSTPPAVQTNNTNTGNTDVTSSGVEVFSLVSGEPTFAIGNYDIGVYTGLGALALAALLFIGGSHSRGGR